MFQKLIALLLMAYMDDIFNVSDKGFIRVLFFDMYPLAFFDFFGVFLSGESYAANEKSRKVDFFRCKPDLSTRTGLVSKSKIFFLIS